jgi:hypothetical protein
MQEKPKISEATLKNYLGENLTRSILSRKRNGKPLLIPYFEGLIPGDILLTKSLIRGKPNRSSAVYLGQKTHEKKNFSEENSFWTHAMVYVGNMHVVESQLGRKSRRAFLNLSQNADKGADAGLKVSPITDYSYNYEILICRLKDLSREDSHKVALYALSNCFIDKRTYPIVRITTSTLSEKPKAKDLHLATTCSEFSLECLAIGTGNMTAVYVDVKTGNEDYYPADFHKSEQFEKIPMTYFQLD